MSAERLFLDTGYVQALLNRRDEYHAAARSLLPRVQAAGEVYVTEAILTEIGNALARSNRAAAAAFIESCYVTPNIRVVVVDGELFRRGRELYRSRPDKTWGLTDCISFIVMQEENLLDALTMDVHFVQAGFHTLLRMAGSA